MKKNPLLAVLLSAFIWPGAGQFYNREFKRGILLVGLTLLLCLSFVIGAEKEIRQRMPADMTTFDMAKAQVVMQDILKKNSDYVMTFNLLMFAAWLYSVADAYWTAKQTLQPPEEAPPPDNDDTPV